MICLTHPVNLFRYLYVYNSLIRASTITSDVFLEKKITLILMHIRKNLQNRNDTARQLTHQVKVGDKVTKETDDNGEDVEDVAIVAPNLETDISTET